MILWIQLLFSVSALGEDKGLKLTRNIMIEAENSYFNMTNSKILLKFIKFTNHFGVKGGCSKSGLILDFSNRIVAAKVRRNIIKVYQGLALFFF